MMTDIILHSPEKHKSRDEEQAHTLLVSYPVHFSEAGKRPSSKNDARQFRVPSPNQTSNREMEVFSASPWLHVYQAAFLAKLECID